MITIHPIHTDKKRYIDLLLLADEQEDMIDQYLERGEMFALFKDEEAVAVCVVTHEEATTYELKNLAVHPNHQRKGYGRMLIDYLLRHYRQSCQLLYVGTGDSPSTLPFYERCGFVYSHRIPHFFTTHYDHPIIEAGRLLDDMVYLKRLNPYHPSR